eukprot:CAMPEP_0197674156 /NCGR_PEP_ID=MMETSP1338-20131121/82367_1 /TAXON_ID=43686 ORGANISM="Pelagodinium beii, Strain RCC1491" /NCGR_SAMPLE_ID=MMETSP1338 /ASSEMBLY_ACC=CAM_ASM_000754 /LENGTH=261 /DNA_ID=CAMNT_0043254503 /DNA_START=99 /DNA_END=880 /DNA_ORIENTATION=+
MACCRWHWALWIWTLCALGESERLGVEDLTDELDISPHRHVRAHHSAKNSSAHPAKSLNYGSTRAEALELQKASKLHVEHVKGPLITATEDYAKKKEAYENDVNKLHGAHEDYKRLVHKYRSQSRQENSKEIHVVKEELDEETNEVENQDDAVSDAAKLSDSSSDKGQEDTDAKSENEVEDEGDADTEALAEAEALAEDGGAGSGGNDTDGGGGGSGGDDEDDGAGSGGNDEDGGAGSGGKFKKGIKRFGRGTWNLAKGGA